VSKILARGPLAHKHPAHQAASSLGWEKFFCHLALSSTWTGKIFRTDWAALIRPLPSPIIVDHPLETDRSPWIPDAQNWPWVHWGNPSVNTSLPCSFPLFFYVSRALSKLAASEWAWGDSDLEKTAPWAPLVSPRWRRPQEDSQCVHTKTQAHLLPSQFIHDRWWSCPMTCVTRDHSLLLPAQQWWSMAGGGDA
jgi:hypothetical protein